MVCSLERAFQGRRLPHLQRQNRRDAEEEELCGEGMSEDTLMITGDWKWIIPGLEGVWIGHIYKTYTTHIRCTSRYDEL